MKTTMNLVRFVLAIFIPGAIFIWISSVLNFDSDPYVQTIVIISILFSAEVIAIQRGETFLWAVISKSFRDIFVFAFSLFLLGCLDSLPKFLGIESWWVSVSFTLVGLLVMFTVIKFLGSKAMNDEFSKPRKRSG